MVLDDASTTGSSCSPASPCSNSYTESVGGERRLLVSQVEALRYQIAELERKRDHLRDNKDLIVANRTAVNHFLTTLFSHLFTAKESG